MGCVLIKHKCKCGYEEHNYCPTTTWVCPKCSFSKRKIFHKCKDCGHEEYTMSPNWTCKCKKEFICNICNEKFIFEGKDLNYYKNKKYHICKKCESKLKGNGKGIYKCNNCGNFIKATNNFNICPHCNSMINKCNNGLKFKYCNKCNKNTLHNANMCTVCFPYSSNKNFTIKDNVVYFKGKNWEIFKNEFKNKIKNCNIPKNFVLIPTFRCQNSDSWKDNGKAFEQYLIDSNIGWFVYIKFDQNNNPLVVGKSGSLLVNKGGTDVRFTINENDGPSRKYLIENNLDWNKTQIAIFSCNTEEEAYKIEKEIQKEYNLFES